MCIYIEFLGSASFKEDLSIAFKHKKNYTKAQKKEDLQSITTLNGPHNVVCWGLEICVVGKEAELFCRQQLLYHYLFATRV